MKHRLALLALGLASTCGFAAGMADQIRIEHAHVRLVPPAAPNTAAFLTMHNTGDAPARLTGAASNAATTVELHDHIRDGDIMRMRRIDGGIPLPAHGSATLAPGGKHIMLIGLTQPLKADTAVDITLHFADGSPHTATLPVKPVAHSMTH